MEKDALEFRMQNDVSILLEEGSGAKGRPRSNTGVASVSLHQICTLLEERKAKGLGQVWGPLPSTSFPRSFSH